MSRKTIRINFTGLSIRNEFNPNDNYILDILRKRALPSVCIKKPEGTRFV